MRAIATAVTDSDGSVFRTLDISGPSYRLPNNDQIAHQIRHYVADLESELA